jgi:hypothetical protein
MTALKKIFFFAAMMLVFYIGTFVLAEYAAAGEIARDGRFIAYDDGTVLDTRTNLMWAVKDNGRNINWTDAKSYSENYRGGGYTDWRMPTQDELVGLYDGSKSRPAACKKNYNIHVATELIDITCFWLWTSAARVSDAAVFNFRYGERTWSPQVYATNSRVLLVRSGK